jgi:ferredoxin
MGNKKRVVNWWLSLWPVAHLLKRISDYPPFRQLTRPVLARRIFDVTFVPINEEIPTPEESFLPYEVLAELVKASSHRFIYNGCICRQKEGCKNYPQDLGCIFLGEAAAYLDPSMGHRAGVEECLEHIEKMSETGLTGMIGRLWMDATALGVLRKFGDFLVVCFCCDCCCIVRTDMRNASPYLKRGIRKLESVRISVSDACKGCGTCEKNCFISAVKVKDGRAVIDQSLCKACGRCSIQCPQDAISVEFDRKDELVAELFERVGAVIEGDRLTGSSERH